jgi:glutathione S-transferase
MKLYYSPGACSLSPHIVSREAGIPLELIRVDTKTHRTQDGGDFYQVNPQGYVPTLVLDDGEILTEGPAIVQYLADLRPDAGLMPKGRDRYRVLEWLNFVAAELHKQFTLLFSPRTPAEFKEVVRDGVTRKLALVDGRLAGRSYLTGDSFTIADAYLFVVANWSRFHQIDLAQWPNLKAFMDRVRARPMVQEALKAEGLIKIAS